MNIDITNSIRQDAFQLLDSIRESGQINMFGASPYLEEVYGISRRQARALLQEWMKTFSTRHPK